MSLFDRIVLTLYMFILTLVSVVMIIFPFNVISFISSQEMKNYIDLAKGNYWVSIIGLAFLLVSIKFLLSGVKINKREKYITRTTEHGELRISTRTIEGLASTVIESFEKIKDVETKVDIFQEGIIINIKGLVYPDSNIPEITVSIQSKVKEHVENCTGLKVREIKVQINNITTPKNMIK